MNLLQLDEVIWRFYENGRTMANNQTLIKEDVRQKVRLLLADAMRQRYYESKKMDEFLRPDFSFVSPLLEIKRFDLGEQSEQRFRRCEMKDFNLYRLPGNSHFTNIYPVGDCGNDDFGEITQVNPGEENFYINDPDMAPFMFYVVKGKGINVYNIPPCVKKLDIEATYDGDDIEVEGSIASAIMDQILNVVLGIKKQYYSDEAKRQMEEQNIIK